MTDQTQRRDRSRSLKKVKTRVFLNVTRYACNWGEKDVQAKTNFTSSLCNSYLLLVYLCLKYNTAYNNVEHKKIHKSTFQPPRLALAKIQQLNINIHNSTPPSHYVVHYFLLLEVLPCCHLKSTLNAIMNSHNALGQDSADVIIYLSCPFPHLWLDWIS